MTPEEFAKQLKVDYDKFGNIIKVSGAKLD
jgi:hypothetical protein